MVSAALAASFTAAAASSFDFASALVASSRVTASVALAAGFLLPVLRQRLGLVRLCKGERLVGGRELGVSAPLEQFQLVQRRCERCRLARCYFGGFLRLGAAPVRCGGDPLISSEAVMGITLLSIIVKL